MAAASAWRLSGRAAGPSPSRSAGFGSLSPPAPLGGVAQPCTNAELPVGVVPRSCARPSPLPSTRPPPGHFLPGWPLLRGCEYHFPASPPICLVPGQNPPGWSCPQMVALKCSCSFPDTWAQGAGSFCHGPVRLLPPTAQRWVNQEPLRATDSKDDTRPAPTVPTGQIPPPRRIRRSWEGRAMDGQGGLTPPGATGWSARPEPCVPSRFRLQPAAERG